MSDSDYDDNVSYDDNVTDAVKIKRIRKRIIGAWKKIEQIRRHSPEKLELHCYIYNKEDHALFTCSSSSTSCKFQSLVEEIVSRLFSQIKDGSHSDLERE